MDPRVHLFFMICLIRFQRWSLWNREPTISAPPTILPAVAKKRFMAKPVALTSAPASMPHGMKTYWLYSAHNQELQSSYRQPACQCFPPIVFTPRASQTARTHTPVGTYSSEKDYPGFNVVLVSAIPIKAELYGSACVNPAMYARKNANKKASDKVAYPYERPIAYNVAKANLAFVHRRNQQGIVSGKQICAKHHYQEQGQGNIRPLSNFCIRGWRRPLRGIRILPLSAVLQDLQTFRQVSTAQTACLRAECLFGAGIDSF